MILPVRDGTAATSNVIGI